MKDVQDIAFSEDQGSEDSFQLKSKECEGRIKILVGNLDGRIHAGRATFSRSHILNQSSNFGCQG